MIARRRKRPRVRSVSWRTLFWLIRTEAEFYVRYGDTDPGARPRRFLYWIHRTTTTRRRVALDFLHHFPERGSKP